MPEEGTFPRPAEQRRRPGSVLVVGDVINDVLVRPLGPVTANSDTRAEIVRRAGGSAANVACWLGSVGAAVRFVGRVGGGDLDHHTAQLARFGVDVHLVEDRTGETGTIVIVVDEHGGRTMLVDRAVSLNLVPEDVPHHLMRDARVLHLTGYTFFEPGVRRTALALLARARRDRVAVSVDPSSVGFLDEVGAENFLRWTATADVCFPNRDEARCLTGSTDPEIAAARLTKHYRTVVITLDRDGCLVAGRSSATVRVPADRVVPVDTTGAGDAFCAGFIHHWSQDRDPVAAAQSGVRVARTAVLTMGGRPALG